MDYVRDRAVSGVNLAMITDTVDFNDVSQTICQWQPFIVWLRVDSPRSLHVLLKSPTRHANGCQQKLSAVTKGHACFGQNLLAGKRHHDE
jgi:hypothetical protein